MILGRAFSVEVCLLMVIMRQSAKMLPAVVTVLDALAISVVLVELI